MRFTNFPVSLQNESVKQAISHNHFHAPSRYMYIAAHPLSRHNNVVAAIARCLPMLPAQNPKATLPSHMTDLERQNVRTPDSQASRGSPFDTQQALGVILA